MKTIRNVAKNTIRKCAISLWKKQQKCLEWLDWLSKDLGLLILLDSAELAEKRVGEVSFQTKQGARRSLKIRLGSHVERMRYKTFFTKEPDTIAWINDFGAKDIGFVDVGANIGLYSLYYSAMWGGECVAIEPSVMNISSLLDNVNLNSMENDVTVLFCPLSRDNQRAMFSVTDLVAGSALNDFGSVSEEDVSSLRYKTLGFSIDTLLELVAMSSQQVLLKIDVDGIEDQILQGACYFLATRVESCLVEVDHSREGQAERCARVLSEVGFEMISENFNNPESKLHYNTANQIWVAKTR